MEQPTLHTVLQALHEISGFRISVHDTAFREIAAFPSSHSPFCSFLQQQDRRVRPLCLQADADACERVRAKQDVYIYRCPFGLYEAVAPLSHFGVPVGYLMMGQAGADGGKSEIKRAAAPYCTDTRQLSVELTGLATTTREKILACFGIMRICSEYITLTNRLNLPDNRLAPAVRRYIVENCGQPLSLEGLCIQFFCSRSTLLRAFRDTYGITVGRCITEVRLEKAAQLLSGTGESVRQISEQCGFADQNYFSKVFRKAFAVSPTEFRTVPPIQPENPT